MSKLITHIKRLALALCLATPFVSWAATSVYSTYNNDTDTPSAGGAYTGAQTFQLNADWMFKVEGEDIAATASAVKIDSIMVYWPGNTHGNADIGHNKGGEQPDAYLVLTTPQGIVVGVSGVNDKKWVAWNNSTYTFDGGVVVSPNAQYEFRWVTDTTGIVVGEPFPSASQKYARVLGAWHSSGKTADSTVHIGFSTDSGDLLKYSVWSRFTVSEVTATTLTTGAEPVALSSGTDPVVVTGAVEGGIVNVAPEATVPSLTVIGEATTLKLADTLTADYVYLPAAVTIDASAVSGLEPTGEDTSKTTPLLSCGLSYKTAPTVIFPNAAATIYEASVTDSGISVTATKGADCVKTITENTSWSTIKPAAWIDLISGDKPAIEITYEGEDPVTLTFDETVTAGMLKLTGNIVVAASAAATFGTVTAGAGSVVEMANMTITTQSGAGTYRYRSGYPIGVPQNKVYEYVGGTSESPVVVSDAFDVYGYLKLSGFFRFADYAMSPVGTLDVLSGKVNVNCSGTYLKGVITIRDDAEFVNEKATDALGYGDSTTVNVYGTLTMGNTRWTVGNNNTINVYGGAITGAGDGNNGALDFIGSSVMNAYADSTVSAAIRFRNALTPVTVAQNVTLTLENIKQGFDAGGVTKKGAGTLKFTSNPALQGGITVEAGTLAFDTESDVDRVVTYTASALNSANMDYINASNWKGTVVISAVAAGNTATQVALNKTSQANQDSYLTLNEISGNAWCAGSTYTVQPEITLAGNVNFQNGSSGQTVTFRKIASGTGNLSLKSWSGGTGVGYGFTTLDADNYTGEIQLEGASASSKVTFNVGDILKVGATAGAQVLPLTANEFVTVNLENATVNGEAADLEVKEDGIYIADPVVNVTITVPNVLNATVVVSDGSTTYEPTTEGGASYVVPEGANITATYTADEGYSFDGATSSFELLNVAEGDEVTVGELVAKAYVASFNSQKYTTLQAAVNAWAAADMMTAYMNLVTLIDDVTEASVSIPARADSVPCQLSSANKTLTGNVTIEADATLSTAQTSFVGNVVVNGTIYTLTALTVDGDITIADGGAVSTTSLGETAILTATGTVTASGEITITLYSNSLTAGTYPVVAGESVEATGIQPTVLLNNVEDPSWAFSVTETQIVLTGAAARVGDETYADFADAVTAAAGEETIELLNNIAYTLAVDETIIIKAGTYTFNVSVPAGYVVEATAQGDGVVSYTTAVAGANLKRERLDGDWEVTSSVDYKTVAEAIAEAGEDGAALRWTVTLLADATDITLDRAITVNAGEYDVTGTITVTVDGATVTVSNEPTLGADTWVTLRNNGTITVRHGVTSTVTVSVTGEGTAALETGDLVKATETAGTYSVKDGTNVKLTAEFGDEYKVDETSTYTNPTGTNTLPQPAAQQDYVMVPVNGNTTISVVIVLDTVSFEVAAVAGTTVVVMDGAVEVVPVAGVYTIPVGNTVQITWVEDADHIVTNGQTDWITPGDGTTVAAPAGMTVEDVVATIGSAKYATLASAVAAAKDSDIIVIVDNFTLDARVTISKSLTLDLGTKTVSGRVTIDAGTVTVQNGTIKGRLDVYDAGTVTVANGTTVDGVVVVWGDGTFGEQGCKTPTLTVAGKVCKSSNDVFAGLVGLVGDEATYDSVIITNGTDSSKPVINVETGAEIDGDGILGIYLPSGVLTVTGGSVSGATAVYAKSGSVTISGGSITGTGVAAEFVHDGNGANPTGDAFVVENCDYPAGAPVVSITGGTFVSSSASAIASYATSGNARITKFAAASLKTSGITEAVASSADVFDDYVDEVPVVPGEQTTPVDTEAAAEEEAAKVVPSVPAAVAEVLSDDQETAYKALFEAKVVPVKDGETTKYAVEVVLKDTVVTALQTAVDAEAEDLAAAAVAAAADATNGGEATVTTKPGLYYVVEAGTELDGIEPASCTLAKSTETKLTVPNKGAKGFYKIRVSVTPVTVPNND